MKLIDFEFATKAVSDQCLLTQCGTPLYIAPEILQGTPYGSKVDVWSVRTPGDSIDVIVFGKDQPHSRQATRAHINILQGIVCWICIRNIGSGSK